MKKEGQDPNPAATSRRESFFGRLSTRLDDWLAVELDGNITAYSGKVELGTGTRTALAQIVAEELDVPFERVQVVMGDTARTPDEGYTAGSRTINSSGTALRQAAAEARQALLELAGEALDAVPGELRVHEGIVSVARDPARAVSYAALMGGKRFDREVTGQAPLKSPQEYHVVGRSIPRVDIPPKLTGEPAFVQDVRLPGMLHARIVYPPSPGARFVSMDESSVKDVPGLVRVVQRGDFIGVVAEREEEAVRAAALLKVAWRESTTLPRMDDLYASLRAQPTKNDVLTEKGDVQAALDGAVQTLHAVYYQPYHAHASIGPACAVADVTPDQATIWASTQGPYPLRGAVAQLIGMPPEKVRLIHVEGAGCYGHNGADDVAADAAFLSQAVGRPVRVQWSREQEFLWEPKSPAMIMDVRGGLDVQGNVAAWDYQVWTPSHTMRARFAGQLLTAQWLNGEPPPPLQFFMGGERNAPTNYAFPNQRVRLHWLASTPLRSSAFRSLGGAANTFANESFIDELAAAAHADAVEFRLRHLADPRAYAVLTTAAQHANWPAGIAPRANQPNQRQQPDGLATGYGVAFAQYENNVAYVATVAIVEVDPASGTVRVRRIVVAHDCGLIINPDGLRNQIEGNVIQSLSRALKEEVHFDETRLTSKDWESYPILTFSEVPDIEVVLINHPEQTAVGAGEPATVTTAAAVANAIFDATGVWVRQVPFTPQRVKAALDGTAV